MKILFCFLWISLNLFAAESTPVLITQSLVPPSFDENERVQIVVQGILPSSCYQLGPSGAVVNDRNKQIEVWQTAYQIPGICLAMTVPYTQTIQAGRIPLGLYEIRDQASENFLGTLSVMPLSNEEGESRVVVTDGYVRKDDYSSNFELTITGTVPDRCTVIKTISVKLRGNVILAQPITEKVLRCLTNERSGFSRTVSLPSSWSDSVRLLYIRSMNGQAVSKLVDLR